MMSKTSALLASLLLMPVFALAGPNKYIPLDAPGAAYSKAVVAGDLVFVAGQLGRNKDGLVPGLEGQSRAAMENLGAVLKAAGLGFDDVVKCQVFVTDINKLGDFGKVYTSFFKPDRLPARTSVGVAGLPMGAEVEVDCIARMQ
jgi:2-iminobutanoate/2-iminopropanoate deaminase